MTERVMAVVGGTVATEADVFAATVVIRNGVIASLDSPESPGPRGAEVIDASGTLVLPGGIDPHVHYWEPGYTDYREDFRTGTSASAAGGVTTVLEHPLSVPPVRDRETFEAKREIAASKSIVDFGLWGAVLPGASASMAELHSLGAVAFKAFMSDAGADYDMVDDGQLFEALEAASRLGALVGVHAESEALTTHFTARVQRRGSPRIADGRPPIAEEEAIQRALVLAGAAKARLHVVHMSVASGADYIVEARRRGVDATSETCSHYLHFDSSQLELSGALAKCKPPLRDREAQDRLWEAVLRGRVDMLASDHAPYTLEEKNVADIWDAPWGLPGAQTMIPTVISDGVIGRSWDIRSFVRFTSTNAARRFGLYPRKGTIRIGSDGDLMLLDTQSSWTVVGRDLLSKQAWSPMDGETLRGRIVKTIVRGQTVYEDGKIVVAPGWGRFVYPVRTPEDRLA